MAKQPKPKGEEAKLARLAKRMLATPHKPREDSKVKKSRERPPADRRDKGKA